MEERKIITTSEVMELVEYIAKNLVDEPDAVKVELKTDSTEQNSEDNDAAVDGTEPADDANVVTIALTVSKDDTGKVIGKQGRIAKAIRTVVRAATVKGDIKYRVDIM